MDKKVYKIEAFLNNSFNDTLKELIESVLSGYDIKKMSYKTSIDPDSVKVSSIFSTTNFKKPKFIYVTFNYMSEGSWTNDGGHQFCKCILRDKSIVLINWSHTFRTLRRNEIIEVNIKFLRKIKLKQILSKNIKQNCQNDTIIKNNSDNLT